MNVTVNEVDQHKVTLHIEVPAKDASKQAAAACKNLASRVNIPGFRKGKVPAAIIDQLDLLRPIYSATAAYGHFGRTSAPGIQNGFTWERTDRVEELQRAAR